VSVSDSVSSVSGLTGGCLFLDVICIAEIFHSVPLPLAASALSIIRALAPSATAATPAAASAPAPTPTPAAAPAPAAAAAAPCAAAFRSGLELLGGLRQGLTHNSGKCQSDVASA
jgi:hypothetical protein